MTYIIYYEQNTYEFTNSVRDGVIMRLFHKYRPLLGHLNLQGCSKLTPESLKHIGMFFIDKINCYTKECFEINTFISNLNT